MRKIIKFLAILLCFILLPVLPAGAADAENSDTYADFLHQLGITSLSDTSNSEREVTRAEFSAMAVKMLNADIVGGEEIFSDVESDSPYAPYIYTAVSRGLLKGVSEGSFMPESSINYAAAIKILVAALGYEEYAYIKGGYPIGYITEAEAIGITKGVGSFGANEPLEFSSAVRLIANALRCDLRVVTGVFASGVESDVLNGRNCLTEYFGFEGISGLVTVAGYHSALSDYKSDKSEFEISGKRLSCSIENAEKYLCKKADAWFDESGRVHAVLPHNTNALVKVKAEDVWGYNEFTVSVNSGDGITDEKYYLDRGFSFILNGKLITPTEADFLCDDGEVILLDNNGDKKYDAVLATHYTYIVVKSINTQTKNVYDKKRNDINIVLKNEEGYHCSITKDGVEVDYSFLEVNDVLRIAQSRDGYLCDGIVISESVKGTVTEISEDEIYIDSKKYETNAYFEKHASPMLSQSGVFLLDEKGRVTLLTGLYADMVDYGYLLDFGKIEKGLKSEAYIKLFTMDGEVITRALTDKIKFNGKPFDKEADEINDALTNGDLPDYQLIRFGTDKEGNVRLIDTEAPLAENSDTVAKYSGASSAEDSLTKYVDASKTYSYWREQAKAFIPFYTLGNTIILEAPKELYNADATARYDDTAFSIISTASLGNSRSYLVDAYDYDESLTPRIIIVYKGVAQAGNAVLKNPGADDNLDTHLVEKVVSCINEEGESTDRIYTYSAEGFSYFDIDPDLSGAINASATVKPGDLVRFYISGGKICGLSVDAKYDATSKKAIIDYSSGNIDDLISGLTYISGKVFSAVDLYTLSIKADNYPTYESQKNNTAAQQQNNPARLDGLCALKANSNTVVAVYDTKTGMIEHGSLSEISDIRSVGERDASYVAIRLGTYIPEFIVIYR